MCFFFLLPFSQTVQWAKNWKEISTLVKNADADVTPLSNTSSYTRRSVPSSQLQLTSKLSSIWCQKSDFTRHQSSDSFGWLAGPGLREQVFQLARPHRYPAALVSALLPAVGFHRRLDPMGRPLACTDPMGRVLSFVLKLAVTMIWTWLQGVEGSFWSQGGRCRRFRRRGSWWVRWGWRFKLQRLPEKWVKHNITCSDQGSNDFDSSHGWDVFLDIHVQQGWYRMIWSTEIQ